MRVGLGWPNRTYLSDEPARILATGVRDVVDLHWFADRWLVLAALGIRIHARVDWRGELGDPLAEAELFAAFTWRHPEVATWRVRNEPNLESPGVTPAEWHAWLTAFLRRVRELAPNIVISAPAVSPGTPDWLAWLDATLQAAVDAAVITVDSHAYGSPAQIDSVLAEYRKRWNGTILVTEWNAGAGNRYDPATYAQQFPAILLTFQRHDVAVAAYFIWQWQGAPPMPTPVDLRGSAMESAFAAMVKEGNTSDYTSPNHGGPRPQTLGIVIHSTRGGGANLQAEYDATVAWFDDPKSQVSAHAVVGPNGQIAHPVEPAQIAWHAREYNQHHLGIELVQPKHGDPIPVDVVDAGAKIVAGWCRQFQIPVEWDPMHGLCEHWEIPPGVRDGKTDVRAPFDRADFLNRVSTYVQPPINPDEVTLYPLWCIASVQNDRAAGRAIQETRGTMGLQRFNAHLAALGCPPDSYRYGFPCK